MFVGIRDLPNHTTGTILAAWPVRLVAKKPIEELAMGLGRMIDGAVRVICALDYP
jgi:hypothetical protein